MYKVKSLCDLCQGPLEKILDFGCTPLADAFVTNETAVEQVYPLRLGICTQCFLTQLIDVVDSDILFGKDYAFYSGGSPSLISYFKKYAETIKQQYPVQARGHVVDIASNDGTLLKNFLGYSAHVHGIDPAIDPAQIAVNAGIPTEVKMFGAQYAQEYASLFGKPTLITANHVLAHVEHLQDFLTGIKYMLADDGVFIFESHYLPNLVFKSQFDNVYHEHRYFLSLTPLSTVLNKLGLRIVHVEEFDRQGGSIRVAIMHGTENSPDVDDMLAYEQGIGITTLATFRGMQARLDFNVAELLRLLHTAKGYGYTIYGLGAPAKGNTLLNYAKIGTNLIDMLVDKTPYKIGKFSPGMHIPVVDEASVAKPNIYLVLPWNYLDDLMVRYNDFLSAGGFFIVPAPLPRII